MHGPLELFSPAMQTIAKLTSQAWAIGGLSEVIRHNGGLAGILPPLGVLPTFAVVLTGHPLSSPLPTPGHARHRRAGPVRHNRADRPLA